MADPLSILGGVAASIQLVEVAMGALLGTVKFAREYSEIPHKIAIQLDDVNRSSKRVHFICQHIIRHDSNVAIQLNPTQVDRLASSAEDVRLAAKDAESCLLPLFKGVDPTRGRAMQRLWKTVISMTQESAVLEKLHRVDKLNLELIEELQTASITIQAEVRSMLDKTSASASNHQIESLKRLDSVLQFILQTQSTITTGFDEVSSSLRSVDISNTTLVQNTEAIQNKTEEIVLGVKETTKVIQYQTSAINDEIQKQARMSHDDMQRMFHQQELLELRITEEFRRMRDQLLVSLTRPEAPSAEDHVNALVDAPKLTCEDQMSLQNSTLTTLMRYPTALRDAWGRSVRYANSPRRCHCRVRTETYAKNIWRFGVEAARKYQHRDDCPYKQSGYRSWAYSLSVNFYPLLKGRMEVVLGATTGPGVWSMTSPLRAQRIVMRSESPIFQAFSSLPELFMSREYGNSCTGRGKFIPWAIANNHSSPNFKMVWTSGLAQRLEDLVVELETEIARGTFTGEEIDEQGQTILFLFSHLLLMLGNQWKEFEPQLKKLLIAIFQSSVNVEFTAKTDDALLQPYVMMGMTSSDWDKHHYTAFEYLFQRGFAHSCIFDSTLPLYTDWIESNAIDDFHNFSFIGLVEEFNNVSAVELKVLCKHVEVAEACGYDDLALAVIRRSLNDVLRLAKMKSFREGRIIGNRSHFSKLELAVGWIEGIEVLMQLGFDPIPAISQACRLADAASLRCLLRPDQPVFTEDYCACRSLSCSILWLFKEAISSGNREIQDIVVLELKARRQKLYEIALEVFSPKEAVQMELDESSFLLGKAASVFALLKKKVLIPPELDCCEMASPYHFGSLNPFRESGSSHVCKFLDRIYDAGFTNVDENDEFGQTPLFEQLRACSYGQVDYAATFHVIDWFVRRGAKTFTTMEDNWPNVMFHLASSWAGDFHPNRMQDRYAKACGAKGRDGVNASSTESVIKTLQKEEDNCVCYCSSSGCTPAHLLMRCHYREEAELCVRSQEPHDRSGPLRAWIEDWGIKHVDLAYLSRELCRVQIFERLGMVHTCCSGGFLTSTVEPHPRYHWNVIRPPGSHIELIQSDDTFLKAQLDEVMKYYDLWHEHLGFDMETFEESWWMAVDEILPLFPMIPKRDCQCCSDEDLRFVIDAATADQRRAEEHEELLQELGYEDFEDFRDVIIDHFEYRLAEILEADTGSEEEDDEGDYTEESSDSDA